MGAARDAVRSPALATSAAAPKRKERLLMSHVDAALDFSFIV